MRSTALTVSVRISSRLYCIYIFKYIIQFCFCSMRQQFVNPCQVNRDIARIKLSSVTFALELNARCLHMTSKLSPDPDRWFSPNNSTPVLSLRKTTKRQHPHFLKILYGRPSECHNKITQPIPSTKRKGDSSEQKPHNYK